MGMTFRTHGAWLSDHTADPDVCRFMQVGAARFWPAHFLDSAIRVHRESEDSEATLHNLISRMSGSLSFNGDIAQWSDTATERMKAGVAIYKKIRPLLSGKVRFPLPQPRTDRDWDAVQIDRPDGRLLFAYRMEGNPALALGEISGAWQLLLGTVGATVNPDGQIELSPSGAALFIEANSPINLLS